MQGRCIPSVVVSDLSRQRDVLSPVPCNEVPFEVLNTLSLVNTLTWVQWNRKQLMSTNTEGGST